MQGNVGQHQHVGCCVLPFIVGNIFPLGIIPYSLSNTHHTHTYARGPIINKEGKNFVVPTLRPVYYSR
jgi:hypothetical protein